MQIMEKIIERCMCALRSTTAHIGFCIVLRVDALLGLKRIARSPSLSPTMMKMTTDAYGDTER